MGVNIYALAALIVMLQTVSPVHVYAEPYGPAREQARDRVIESTSRVDAEIAAVKVLMKKGIIGDKEHDEYAVILFEELNQNWKKLRDTQCSLEAQLEVFPASSLLYAQTINHCIWKKNNEQIVYLRNIAKTIKTYKD